VETGGRDIAKTGFAIPVQWVNRPDADFRGFSGTIATGTVAVGAEVVALPSGKTSRITRIVTANGDLEAAQQGQAVTLVLADEIDLSRGDVLAAENSQAGPTVTSEITARLILTGERAVTVGAEFLLKLGTSLAKATITGLRHAIDIESYAETPAERLHLNAIGVVTLRLDREIALTNFADNADLGGFILIDRLSNETSAFGFVDLPAESNAAAKPVLRLITSEGSATPQQRLPLITWRIVSALATGAVVFTISGDPRFAIGAALADLTLRPLARLGHDALWRRLTTRNPALKLERSGA
jgi:bifunctional enzyme CysN/CysC